MNIPTNLLRAVALASGRKDIRFYLNGVRVICKGRNVTLVATDGFRLHVGSFKDGSAVRFDFEVTLPIEAVRAALDTSDLVIELKRYLGGRWTLPRHVQFEGVGGKYPNWRRITPDPLATGPFDAGHVGDVLRAARMLVKRKPAIEVKGSLFTVGGVDDFYAVLLTRRQ